MPRFLSTSLPAALACASLWLASQTASAAPEPVPVGQALPEVTLSGLNGADRPLSSFRGRRLIINVWASWCGPCRAEAASLERFAWSSAGAKYTVIGVSTDDYRDAAQRWLKQSNATLSHFIDRQLELENLLGASRIPLTVLVDEQGRVVARVQGAREWDTAPLRELIEREYAGFVSARRGR